MFGEDDPGNFDWVARGGQHANRVHKLPGYDAASPNDDQETAGPSPLLAQLQREDVTSVDDINLQEAGLGGDA